MQVRNGAGADGAAGAVFRDIGELVGHWVIESS